MPIDSVGDLAFNFEPTAPHSGTTFPQIRNDAIFSSDNSLDFAPTPGGATFGKPADATPPTFAAPDLLGTGTTVDPSALLDGINVVPAGFPILPVDPAPFPQPGASIVPVDTGTQLASVRGLQSDTVPGGGTPVANTPPDDPKDPAAQYQQDLATAKGDVQALSTPFLQAYHAALSRLPFERIGYDSAMAASGPPPADIQSLATSLQHDEGVVQHTQAEVVNAIKQGDPEILNHIATASGDPTLNKAVSHLTEANYNLQHPYDPVPYK